VDKNTKQNRGRVARFGKTAIGFGRRMTRDEGGASAVFFAVALLMLTPMTLGLVDVYISTTQRGQLQDALDTATLYAARSSATTTAEIDTIETATAELEALCIALVERTIDAAFIKNASLDDAKAALADPARARETILSIAFEAGFTSLPTFNRVFRETEGVTPTVFRTQALSEPAQNQKTLLPS